MNISLFRIILCASLLTLSCNSAFAQFWDQHANNGAARSDFNSPTKGTASNPLWHSNLQTYLSWPNSNWVEFGNTAGGYWVFHANDEPIPGLPNGTQSAEPDGPPGQVHAIAEPGTGGYGFFFTHIDDGTQNDGLHFIINTDFLGSPQARRDWSDIPFLSVGAERDRGNNGTPPAILNGFEHWQYGDHHMLRFDAKLWESTDGSHGDSYRHAGFYVVAEWCGYTPSGYDCTPRGVFVDLHEQGSDSVSTLYDANGLTRLDDWEWPFPASFFDPGADWLFARMDAFPTLASQYTECQGVMGGTGAGIMLNSSTGMKSYSVHLTKLFECMDKAFQERDGKSWPVSFPTSEVEVRGIHWYVEAARNGDPDDSSLPGDQTSAIMWLQIADPNVSRL